MGIERNRRRSPGCTPLDVLGLMLWQDDLSIDPDRAAQAFGVLRQTIIQAVCRLRRDGLRVWTHPDPPRRVVWYQLDGLEVPRAMEKLLEVGYDAGDVGA